MSHLRGAASLRNIPTYKQIRRRIVEPVQSSTSAPTSSALPPTAIVSLANLDEIKDDLDEDEFFDPFAPSKPSATTIRDDDADYDDDDDDMFFDDGDDEQALLLLELRKIKDEQEKEHQHKIKEELPQQHISIGGHSDLFSNPLLKGNMTSLLKEEQLIKGEVARDEDKYHPPAGTTVKRKKLSDDTVFSNTALALGDSDMIKKQRLNNDTTNSDKHKQFLGDLFK